MMDTVTHEYTLKKILSYDIESLFNKPMSCAVVSLYLRSGSYFLHSLLDGHSKLLCLPPWASLIYREENLVHSVHLYLQKLHSQDWGDSREFAQFMHMLMQPAKLWEKHDKGSTVYCFLGDAADIPIDAPMEYFLDYLQYIVTFLQKKSMVSRRNYILAIAIAYNLAHKVTLEEIEQKTWLLYQLHAPIVSFLEIIKEDFQKVFFIQTIRNPLKALASYVQEYALYIPQNIPYLFEWLFAHGTIPSCLAKEHCIAVKNEYLHMYGKRYIERLLQHMGLEWEDICAKATVNKQTFWWIKKGKIFTGINPQLYENYCDAHTALFDCHDKIILSHFLQDRFTAWNYEMCPQTTYLQIVRQIKNTSIKIYQENAEYKEFLLKYSTHTRLDVLTLQSVFSMHFLANNPSLQKETDAIIGACIRGLQEKTHQREYMPILNEDDLSYAVQPCIYT